MRGLPETSVVTGAAGFIGSHLVDRLLGSGARVVGLDNLSTGSLSNLGGALAHPNFRLVRSTLPKTRQIPRAELYLHLASPAAPSAWRNDPVGTLRANSEGTFKILESARRWDAEVLIASTSEVYGDPEVHPQPECYWGSVNPVGDRSCYDEGKRYAEALTVAFRRAYGLDARIARIFNTYGPRMSVEDGRAPARFIIEGLRRVPFTIQGTGRQTRSFCYVTDLVDGLLRQAAARPSVPSPLNIGSTEEITILDLARVVAVSLDVPMRIRRVPLPEDDPKRRRPDISLARHHLRWCPRVPLSEGVRRTADYFRGLPRVG